MNRQSGELRCRGVLAYCDHRLDEVVVYASTQTLHTIRVALGEILGLEERVPELSRPMSVVELGQRPGSIPRKSYSPRWRSSWITRCAGSRTTCRG